MENDEPRCIYCREPMTQLLKERLAPDAERNCWLAYPVVRCWRCRVERVHGEPRVLSDAEALLRGLPALAPVP